MQGINSLLNSSQISLQDLHNNNNNHHHHHEQQIQNSPMNNHHQHNFDPTSHDDFLEQMLSNLNPSCSWPDLNPKPLWEPNPSGDTPPSSAENVGFPYDEHANLASKFQNHQISAPSPTSKAAATLILQQQLLMSRGLPGAADSGLLQMQLSSLGAGDFDRSRNDVVEGSSFKSPSQPGEASVQGLYNGFAGSLHGTGQASNQAQHFQHPQGGPNPIQGQSFGGSGAATNQAPASETATGSSPAQPRQRVRARRGQATDPHSIAERVLFLFLGLFFLGFIQHVLMPCKSSPIISGVIFTVAISLIKRIVHFSNDRQ